jgi:hypothetical protein
VDTALRFGQGAPVSWLRTFVALGFGLFAGGIVGGYAITVVYGVGAPRVEKPSTCPPAPAPSCPPCELAATPDTVEELPDAGTSTVVLPGYEAPRPKLPGLPTSAVRLASQGVEREVQACAAGLGQAEGTVIVDFTITATAGQGFLRAVRVVRTDRRAVDLLECVERGLPKVRFEWGGSDGETRLRYPLLVGKSE